jgi:diguanylate cyclase (GGDEF)-like protein/PAS domain S-box-containing protein
MTDPRTSKLEDLTNRFRELHRLSLGHYDSYAKLYSDYLVTGMRFFDMSIGIVSRIGDGQYVILAVEPETKGLASGDAMTLGDTYCSVVVDRDMTVAVSHAGQDAALCGHPAYREMQLEAYLATPIRVNGEIYGTLNFSSPQARDFPFDETDVELVELMAGRIGQIIEQDQLDRERQRAIRQLRENTELFESAFEYAAIGMALVSLEGRWLRVNNAAIELLGYSETELLTNDFQALTHPDDLDKDLELLREMLSGERDTYRMEKRYFHKNRQEIWALLSVSMVRDENGKPEYVVSQMQDISAQKRAEAALQQRQKQLEALNDRLEQLSSTDPLTQLNNRRALEGRLHEELSRSKRTGEPLSLLIVDVDHFKRYNDSYGHPEGDQALRALAAALRDVSRTNDTVARLGGEEFVLLLPHTDASGCCAVARRLAQLVSRLEGLRVAITVSTGGATLVPVIGSIRIPTADALMRRADEALYRAKQEGRNRHCQAP